ncbi:MAG: glycosyltransferase [Ruminococcus sp.]|nr:glycosyltransferase [Ruminococcus sp.]
MKNKIRILEVNKAYFPHTGGIETLVKQYSEELGKFKNIEVRTLVCRDGIGKTCSENINGVRLVRAGSFGTYFSCPVSMSFLKIFRKMSENADVIHIHVPFPLTDLALLLSGYSGKVIVSWHSDIVKQKKLLRLYKPLMKYLLNRADCILVATEGHIYGSEFLPEYHSKCRVLPYGISPENYTDIKKIPFLTEKLTNPESIKVFFTGRLVYYKGVDVLINAFRKVGDNCELFIAGTGILENQLKEKVHEYGLNDRVHFLGFLPDAQLKQAFSDCDIFILPSVEKSEAFGIVQLEAMIYGKPVINTNLPSGVPYVSIHEKTGITVQPKNSVQLAEAINILRKNKNLREKLGQNARKRVLENFNEKNVIQDLYKIITDEVNI